MLIQYKCTCGRMLRYVEARRRYEPVNLPEPGHVPAYVIEVGKEPRRVGTAVCQAKEHTP